MASISIKKDKKMIQAISFDLYKTRENIAETAKKIEHYGLAYLIELDNNGITSNILNYAIERNDIQTVELISTQSSLMKRDLLKLIKFCPCQNFIDRVIPQISGEDLPWIISNNLIEVLEKCVGKFLVMESSEIIQGDPKLEIKTLTPELCESIKITIIEKVANPKIFARIKPKEYNVIIDGGNVIHSINGKISRDSYTMLEKIIELCKKKFQKVLLVIHKFHWNKHPKIVEIITKAEIDYYLSPPTYYDDLFIMWYFVCNPTCYIVSNDKFSDHFYYLNQDPQFKHISGERVLNYSTKDIEISEPTTVSRCIQKIDNSYWIPCVKNKYINGWIKIL